MTIFPSFPALFFCTIHYPYVRERLPDEQKDRFHRTPLTVTVCEHIIRHRPVYPVQAGFAAHNLRRQSPGRPVQSGIWRQLSRRPDAQSERYDVRRTSARVRRPFAASEPQNECAPPASCLMPCVPWTSVCYNHNHPQFYNCLQEEEVCLCSRIMLSFISV